MSIIGAPPSYTVSKRSVKASQNPLTRIAPYVRPRVPDADAFEHLEDTSLPRLPIAPLDFTLQKYLRTVRCLLSEQEYKRTERIVNEFAKQDGASLHAELLELGAQSPTSYIEGFWDTMYLEGRWSAVEVNPWFLLRNDPRRLTPAMRAANLVYSSLLYARMINQNKLPRSMERDIPLCMTQFQWLFLTQIPQRNRDYKIRNSYSNHIVVLHNNNIYRLHLVDQHGEPFPENVLTQDLQGILDDTDTGDSIAVLSSNSRDAWAADRLLLLESDKSGTNARSLDIIDTALLVLVFHPEELHTINEFQHAFVHGTEPHCTNRYYDKMQIIVTQNAAAGVSMNHVGVDADTTASWLSFMVDRQFDTPVVPMQEMRRPQFEKLKWNLCKSLRRSIKTAHNRLVKWINSLDLAALEFTDFGVEYIKKHIGVSPDAFCQMAIQLAYYRLHSGESGSTYEAMNVKRFYHGRTTCCRSVSVESQHFCSVMSDPNSTVQDKDQAFRAACKRHKDNVLEAKAAKDVDRPLYALQNLALLRVRKYPYYQMPEFFTDVAWTRMRTDLLSTSSIPSGHIRLGGFVPVTARGFGVSYLTSPNSFQVTVSNYDGRAALLTNSLRSALLDMKNLGGGRAKL